MRVLHSLFAKLYLPLACLVLLTASMQGQVFQNPRFIRTNFVPALLTVADLNGDGLPDLLVDSSHVIESASDLFVLHPLLTDGKSGYQPGVDVTLPRGFFSACMSGDVNGDGKADLVCSGDETHAAVVVLAGQGDGTFAAPIVVPVPPLANQLCNASYVSAIGDLNNDGHADVVVTCEVGNLAVPMLGDGTGHFTAATPLYVSATSIQLADLNGDGKPDMLAQGIEVARTQILLGKGDGTFDYGQSWPTFGNPSQANQDSLLGDLDGDGHPDLIGGGFGIVRIYRGHADGTFDTTPTQVLDFQQGVNSEQLGFGVYLYPLACRDLDGDGIEDLVAFGENGLVVFPGKGGFTFGPPRAYPEEETVTFGNIGGQVLQDLNGDGLPDYLAVGPDGLYLSYGERDGSFVSGKAYVSGRHVSGLAVSDFNEDGVLDAVTAGDLHLYLNLGKGDGTFLEATALPAVSPPMQGVQTRGWTSVAATDVNGDGHSDLLAIGATEDGKPQVSVLLGRGDGSFSAPTAVEAVDGQPNVMALDVNHDGLQDIVLTGAGSVSILVHQKDGTYLSRSATLMAPASEYATGQPTLGDLNGDGIPDLAYVTTNHAAVAAGLGDGNFANPVYYPLALAAGVTASNGGVVALGDLDGDGLTDMAVTLPTAGPGTNDRGTQVFVLYGLNKQGTLDADSFTAAIPGPALKQIYKAIYVADVNGDSRGDVILDPAFGQGFPLAAEVMMGRTDRTLGAVIDVVDGYGEASLAFADLNGDGRADLLKPNTYGNAFTVLLTVQPLKPVGTLVATPDPVLFSSGFTIAAAVSADGQSGPFQGKVTFSVDGKTVGSAALVDGSASIAGPAGLAPGDHKLTAVTSILRDEQGSYAPVSMTSTVRVTPLPVNVSVTASPNPVTTGQATTLAVLVQNGSAAAPGAPLPTGQATVQIDGAQAGSGSGDGTSAFGFNLQYQPQSPGMHTVMVSYPGDATHAAGTATLSLVTAAAGSFNLTVSPASPSVSPSAGSSVQITVGSVDGFSGPVALSYSGLPPNVTATLNPATVTLTAGGHAPATITFTETLAAKAQRERPGDGAKTMMAFAVLAFTLAPSRRRRRWLTAALLCALGGCALGLGGCSGSHQPVTTTYSVTVTGMATGTGAQQKPQSATITLAVVQ